MKSTILINFTYNNRRRVFNFRRTQNIYEMNHMDRWISPNLKGNCGCRVRKRTSVGECAVSNVIHVLPARCSDVDWEASRGHARGRGNTHSRRRHSQWRAWVARTPALQHKPRALRHLTIDALYCINYLGNTQWDNTRWQITDLWILNKSSCLSFFFIYFFFASNGPL